MSLGWNTVGNIILINRLVIVMPFRNFSFEMLHIFFGKTNLAMGISFLHLRSNGLTAKN